MIKKTLPLGLAVLLLGSHSAPAVSVMDVNASDADMTGYVDVAAVRDSAFYQELETLYPISEQDLWQGADAATVAILKGMGITPNSLSQFAFSMTNIQAAMMNQPENMEFGLAARLETQIEAKALKSLIEQGGEDVTDSVQMSLEGETLFATPTEMEPGSPPMKMAFTNEKDSSYLFIGDVASVDRVFSQGGMTASGMKGAVDSLGSVDGYMALVLPQMLRAQLAQPNQQMPSIQQLNTIALGVDADEALHITLALIGDEANSGTSMSSELQMNVMPQMGMMAAMMGPELGKVMQTLSVDGAGNTAYIRLSLTASDIKALENMSQQMGGGAPMP